MGVVYGLCIFNLRLNKVTTRIKKADIICLPDAPYINDGI